MLINEMYSDYIFVPFGLSVLGLYHVWLLFTIIRNPMRTVIGLNTVFRRRWVYHIMRDQPKNGITGVQTLRNNLTASTVLATIAITLCSLISALMSSSTYTIHNFKYFAVLVCFLAAFFCNVQCVRFYSHSSFLLSVPVPETGDEYIEYVAETINQGSLYWSLGMRAFYFAFPLLLWIFGPIPMFICSCLMSVFLYFLDITSTSSMSWYDFPDSHSAYKAAHNSDTESLWESM